MKASARKTRAIKEQYCESCQFNKKERIVQKLDPCIAPEGVRIENGKCLSWGKK
jgi:hypothetical protein